MPSIVSLVHMELNGVGFSEEESERQKKILMARMDELESEAFRLVGHPFQMTSPDDICQVTDHSYHGVIISFQENTLMNFTFPLLSGALPRVEIAPERRSEPPPARAFEQEPKAEAVDQQGGAHKAQAVPRGAWHSPRVAEAQCRCFQGEAGPVLLCNSLLITVVGLKVVPKSYTSGF